MSDELAMPDNLQACQTLVEQLVITIAEQQHQIATLEDKHLAQQLEIAHLIKLAFGRRSERYLEDPNQLKLDLGDSDEVHDAAEGLHDAKQEQAAADELIIGEHIRRKQAKAQKPRDEKLPAHLPRYEVEAEATDEQQHCETHGPREIIGHDRVETLEYVRPQLKVRPPIPPSDAQLQHGRNRYPHQVNQRRSIPNFRRRSTQRAPAAATAGATLKKCRPVQTLM